MEMYSKADRLEAVNLILLALCWACSLTSSTLLTAVGPLAAASTGASDAIAPFAVAAFLLGAAIFYKYRNEFWDFVAQYVDPTLFQLSLDQYVSTIAMFTVIPHFVEIVYQYGVLRGLSWALKILTDPFTDLIDFYPHFVIHPQYFFDFKDQRATYRLDIETKKVTKLE